MSGNEWRKLNVAHIITAETKIGEFWKLYYVLLGITGDADYHDGESIII
jgi:hypothetical protein